MITKKYTYPCIVLNKKSWKSSDGKDFQLVTFYASASDLQIWSGVYRAGLCDKGYQRVLKEKHSREIQKFLDNEENVIPNSVVIAFNKIKIGDSECDGARLSIDKKINPVNSDDKVDTNVSICIGNLEVNVHPDCEAYCLGTKEFKPDDISLIQTIKKSAAIIDGQHRVDGGNAAAPNVYFPVTAFLGISQEDQAFQFIVINGKSQKVSKHDIDLVVPKAVYVGLQERLRKAAIVRDDADIVYALQNEVTSPFKELIVWGSSKPGSKRVITKGGIDKAIEFSKTLDEDIKNEFTSQTDLLIAIWNGIKKHTSDFWDSKTIKIDGHTYSNQFLKKCAAVIPALQKAINNAWQIGKIEIKGNPKDAIEKRVTDAVYDYIKDLPLEVFYCKYKRGSITNDAHIIELASLINTIIRKKKMTYTDSIEKTWFDEPLSNELRKKIKKENKKKKTKSRRA